MVTRTTTLAIALLLSACAEVDAPPDRFGHGDTGLRVEMGALSYPGAEDVCYSFAVMSPLGELVVGRGASHTAPARHPGGTLPYTLASGYSDPLPGGVCATRFGNGPGGAWSYVAPCDASAQGNHTVTVWLDALTLDGGVVAEAGADYQDPCPTGCSVQASCQENADTPVAFNFTIMRRAQQGFFDVAVSFDSVFCAAKVDTCYAPYAYPSDAIRLLHDAFGDRSHTAVAAVACSAGSETETVLHHTDVTITCGAETFTLDLSTVTAEGARTLTSSPSGESLRAAVFFGTEALAGASKVFTNVAFVIPAGGTCSVDWTVVPSESAVGPQPSSGGEGTLAQVPAVSFRPEHALVASGQCDNYSLNGVGPGDDDAVVTAYLEEDIDYTAVLTINAVDFTACTVANGCLPHVAPVDPCGRTVPVAPDCSAAFSGDSGTFVDVRDEQTYPWIRIGSQYWMAANLNYGVQIPATDEQTANCQVEKHCYDNDTANCGALGALYQWQEAMGFEHVDDVLEPGATGVCPAGWYVPTDADWTEMLTFIGGGALNLSTAGGMLKSTETPTTWTIAASGAPSANVGASDAFGFNAYSGGFTLNGGSEHKGYSGNFWSSDRTLYHIITPLAGVLRLFAWSQPHAFSLRCVSACQAP